MMEFTFEQSPWELFSEKLKDNATVSASYILTLLEGETEENVEDAFALLETKRAEIDISDLPKPALTGENGARLKREAELAKQGITPDKLSETDPLRMYLEELAGLPAFGDICFAAEQLAEMNRSGKDNDSLRMQVVNLSLSRVVQLAGEHAGFGVLLLDLIQEGSIGLWKATQCYTGAGVDFEAFRDWWIAFSMKAEILLQARASGVGQNLRQAVEDYRAADEQLLAELGRNPTLEEIAQQLHMEPEKAALVAQVLDSVRRIDRAMPTQEPEEQPQEEDQAVENTAYFQMRQRISDMLSVLSADEAKLLTLRFGLEGGLPMNPEETGRKLGLSAQEVVAKEAAALQKLRAEG